MPCTMALQGDGNGQTGDMGREYLGMNSEGGDPTAVSHRADTELVDMFQDILLELG